ncbi:hypothetical protein [Stutzerimonas nitrititolerans]|uniref:hypothetical protein n=1 Tax=Stutzerimonas nitrititolerans TaxID=2482751 RepID=UPI0028A1BC80|nr:hypothetical protein [Stutzerimonas nitrititolerans]
MDSSAFLSSLLGGAAGVAVIGFISKKWIEARIQQSIKHEYDLKIERSREATLIKAKAQLVAELFAEWLSYRDDQRRLNQLTLEAFLWLPEDILHDLSNLLAHKPGAPSVRDLVIRVRSHLLGASTLPAHEVILFSQETLAKMAERHKAEVAKKGAIEAQQGAQADEPASGGSAA